MSKKGIAIPPPRPPAPKVGSGGISFSFKALEEEDEEELSLVTGKFDKQVHEEKERHARVLERERSLSKSPDIRYSAESTMSKSPSIKSQNSFEKLKDLKDKIQTGIQKKKDELFTDSNVTSAVPGRDRDIDQSTVTIIKEKSSQLRQSPVKQIEHSSSLKTVHADNVTAESETFDSELLDLDTEYFDSKSDDTDDIFVQNNEDDALEINDTYFNPTSEDFSELPGVVPIVRQRKRFQNFRKIKPIVPPAPVSMSKLNEKFPETKPSGEVDTAPDSKKDGNGRVPVDTEPVININGTKIPVKKLIGVVVFLFLYMILPLPSYLSGMIAGGIIASGGWMLYLWVTEPPKLREPIPSDPPLDKLPPLPAPEIKEPKGEDGCFKVFFLKLISSGL